MSAYQLYKCTMKSVLHSPTCNKVLSFNWLHAAISKGPYSKSCGISSSHVWMWELDHKQGWEPENWYFTTVVLEKTLESPLDCRDIKPVNPKGNQPWIFIGTLILKLKLQYFAHLMRRADSLEKTLMLRKISCKRKRVQQRMSWLDGNTNSMNMSLSKLQEIVKDRGDWWATVHGISKIWIWLSEWTTAPLPRNKWMSLVCLFRCLFLAWCPVGTGVPGGEVFCLLSPQCPQPVAQG